ncbi:TGM1 [Mytilus coruscus]|uniref:TGM1 n=1 Tax=Mytilus coruscus TaxID=42192 RepID=A0A6J8CMV2_MYTCO|nr:TGM1 [Mytilus coruscus]
MYYTGVPAKRVKNLAIDNEKIAANKSKELSLKVTFDEYYSKLVDQCHMKMSCMCTILETEHSYVDQDTFRLIKPELKIKAPATGKVGEKIKAEVSFTNPLPCALTSSELTVEGTGLTKHQVILLKVLADSCCAAGRIVRSCSTDFTMRRSSSRFMSSSRRTGSTSTGTIRTRLYSDIIRSRGNRFTLTNFPRRSVNTPTSEGRKPILEREEPPPPVKPDLTVENVDLNISTNSKEHHTDEYSISEEGRGLVVRRGDNPTPTTGTRVSLVLADKDPDKEWGARILKYAKKRLSIRINTPPTCYVGIWKLQIETFVKSDNKTVIFDSWHDQNIYILFNPWCKDDQVYLPEEEWLNEYILNDKEPIEELNTENVWNFHVWNDVWMARPDLPKGYGGWQAIDSTAQEASDGIYRCGPAPLVAIKSGEVYLPYDTPFIFAELNADRIKWQMDEFGGVTKIKLSKNSIGIRISTKLPIGKPYKHPEGSVEERTAVINANQVSSRKGLYHEEGKPMDVQFELLKKETDPYGKDFEISLKITNNSSETRTFSGCINTSSMFYTGITTKRVKKLVIEKEKIGANKSKELSLKVTFDEYYNKLVDQCHMEMSCMCQVLETNQTYVDQDTFRLIKPDLTIKMPDNGKIGKMMKVEVSFTNPLPCALTDCELTVEGIGLTKTQVFPQSIVPSNQVFMATVDFLPTKAGLRELIGSFNSRELAMVDGSSEIMISK